MTHPVYGGREYPISVLSSLASYLCHFTLMRCCTFRWLIIMAGKKKGGPAVPMPGMDEVKYVLGVTSGKGTDAVSFFVFVFFVFW